MTKFLISILILSSLCASSQGQHNFQFEIEAIDQHQTPKCVGEGIALRIKKGPEFDSQANYGVQYTNESNSYEFEAEFRDSKLVVIDTALNSMKPGDYEIRVRSKEFDILTSNSVSISLASNIPHFDLDYPSSLALGDSVEIKLIARDDFYNLEINGEEIPGVIGSVEHVFRFAPPQLGPVEFTFVGKNKIGCWGRGELKKVASLMIFPLSLNAEDRIAVYPNPTQHEILIKAKSAKEEMDYSLIDQKGVIIKSGILKKELQYKIPVDQLTPGMYILNLEINGSQQSHRIVKAGN